MSELVGNWSFPTTIRFGAGRVAELAQACRAAGLTSPLLVTDPGIAALPMLNRIVNLLRQDGIDTHVFSGVDPNPSAANVEAGIAAFRDGGHDGIIALGGGSALDAGKVVAFMQGQSRPIWDFEDIADWWTRADAHAIAPVIAVPTTAGTGSEVGRAGVITNQETHTKKVIFHPKMLPVTVICDPELTLGLPPAITAGTGMDAFAHCLEAYCAPTYHPMCEGIAVEGLRLVRTFLPRAYRDGSDLEARSHMMSAAAMGAVAFQKGLGGVHALSHPVGALYGTHHGLTNAVFLPYVLAFNRPAIADKIARLSDWLGIAGGFDGFFNDVMALREGLGIPHALGGIGVDDARLDVMSDMAVVDPTAGGNPVKLAADDCRRLYEQALAGRP